MNRLLPLFLGILASCFFSVSFILNRAMELSGGYWMWSAALRYLFMLPVLLAIVRIRGNLRELLLEVRKRLWVWIGWSSVGFGLFYVPLCFAAAYGPGWLIAASWQVTIIAGSLLASKNPGKGLLFSLVILTGVVIIQSEHAGQISVREALLGAVPVLLAAFAYPLGNRKMMEVCEGRLDAYQRVLGMTISSLPVWIMLSAAAYSSVGAPSAGQTFQSAAVALSSGVVATVLFFSATDRVKGSLPKLAAVEATQAGEVIFTVLGELVFLGASLPSAVSWTGMFCVVTGMILHSWLSEK